MTEHIDGLCVLGICARCSDEAVYVMAFGNHTFCAGCLLEAYHDLTEWTARENLKVERARVDAELSEQQVRVNELYGLLEKLVDHEDRLKVLELGSDG